VTQQRRRLDIILDDDFIDNLQSLELGELRDRRQVAADVESELSYYRRLLHGRMDLLNFELARRSGEETRSLIEALPQILGAGETAGGQSGRVRGEFDADLAGQGSRPVDVVLQDDFLTRISDMEVSELEEIQEILTETETSVSDQRRAVQRVFDTVQEEITRRYRQSVVDEIDDED